MEDSCKIRLIHREKVEKMAGKIIPDNEVYEISELFKVFSDFTRVKILYILVKEELCVCDIAYLLEMSHSSVSHQLRVLRQAKLVINRKEGKTVFYKIKDNHVKNLIDTALSHIRE